MYCDTDGRVGSRCPASPLGRILATATGAELDRAGRVMVAPDLSLLGHPEIFVIGDLAHCGNPQGQPLPGVAQVAMQQGQYVAQLLRGRLHAHTLPPFSLPIAAAWRLSDEGRRCRRWQGTFFWDSSWFAWLSIHVVHLVEFENRLLVVIQWAWNYFTGNRSARLITGEQPPSFSKSENQHTPSREQ